MEVHGRQQRVDDYPGPHDAHEPELRADQECRWHDDGLDARIDEVEARAADRRSQVGSGDRSERIRTYNFPQGRVTDHRINLTLYKLERVLSGELLDEVIEPLIAEEQAALLAELQ